MTKCGVYTLITWTKGDILVVRLSSCYLVVTCPLFDVSLVYPPTAITSQSAVLPPIRFYSSILGEAAATSIMPTLPPIRIHSSILGEAAATFTMPTLPPVRIHSSIPGEAAATFTTRHAPFPTTSNHHRASYRQRVK
jgi:hypothetical protein